MSYHILPYHLFFSKPTTHILSLLLDLPIITASDEYIPTPLLPIRWPKTEFFETVEYRCSTVALDMLMLDRNYKPKNVISSSQNILYDTALDLCIVEGRYAFDSKCADLWNYELAIKQALCVLKSVSTVIHYDVVLLLRKHLATREGESLRIFKPHPDQWRLIINRLAAELSSRPFPGRNRLFPASSENKGFMLDWSLTLNDHNSSQMQDRLTLVSSF